jgi:hypothetical protein
MGKVASFKHWLLYPPGESQAATTSQKARNILYMLQIELFSSQKLLTEQLCVTELPCTQEI